MQIDGIHIDILPRAKDGGALRVARVLEPKGTGIGGGRKNDVKPFGGLERSDVQKNVYLIIEGIRGLAVGPKPPDVEFKRLRKYGVAFLLSEFFYFCYHD